LFKEPCDQREDAAVRYLVPDTGKKTIFGDRVEIALQIGVDDVDVAGREPPFDPPQRISRLREGRLLQPRLGQKHPACAGAGSAVRREIVLNQDGALVRISVRRITAVVASITPTGMRNPG
jgi:hypothetical protein